MKFDYISFESWPCLKIVYGNGNSHPASVCRPTNLLNDSDDFDSYIFVNIVARPMTLHNLSLVFLLSGIEVYTHLLAIICHIYVYESYVICPEKHEANDSYSYVNVTEGIMRYLFRPPSFCTYFSYFLLKQLSNKRKSKIGKRHDTCADNKRQ